ncbi:hypothetical protein BDV11DRAFT_186208 [Aspergillus similis]
MVSKLPASELAIAGLWHSSCFFPLAGTSEAFLLALFATMMPGAVQIPTYTIMHPDRFGSNLRSLSASFQPRLMENLLVTQRSFESAVDLQCMNGGAGPVRPGHMEYYRFRHLVPFVVTIGYLAQWLMFLQCLFPNTPHSPGFLHLAVGLAR